MLTNQTIQKLIDDAAKRGGGTVTIPAGVYMLRNAIHLRSNVNLRGEGEVILRKVPSEASALALRVGYGHFEFRVKEPDRFQVGDGVLIRDSRAGGFYTTTATIVERDGDTFFIDRMFNHDYADNFEGIVESLHPLVEGLNVQNVKIENLTLDGNTAETRSLNGCRGGGIFLIQCRGVSIRNVRVGHYKSDGISFQQCIDIAVRDCEVHHCESAGLHPGSGSVRYVFENNHLHHNGRWGIFYCLRTTHSDCRKNLIEHNGLCGISIGERDTDHLIEGNTIRHNTGPSIDFRKPGVQSGDAVQIIGNTLGPNDTDSDIIIPDGLRRIYIKGNTMQTRGAAVEVGSAADQVTFIGNTVNGRQQTRDDVRGGVDRVSFAQCDPGFAVGPAALEARGARHLMIGKLSPWVAPT